MSESAITRWLNLWLTKEQIAQVKKVLGVNLPQGRVPLGPSITMRYGIRMDHSPTPPIATKYGMPMPSTPQSVRIYFTGQQKQQIRSAGGQPCDFAEIKPTLTLRYGMHLNTGPGRP